MHKENYHLNVTSWLFNPYRRLPHYTTKWENLHYEDITWEDEYVVYGYKEVLKRFLLLKIKEEEII